MKEKNKQKIRGFIMGLKNKYPEMKLKKEKRNNKKERKNRGQKE